MKQVLIVGNPFPGMPSQIYEQLLKDKTVVYHSKIEEIDFKSLTEDHLVIIEDVDKLFEDKSKVALEDLLIEPIVTESPRRRFIRDLYGESKENQKWRRRNHNK